MKKTISALITLLAVVGAGSFSEAMPPAPEPIIHVIFSGKGKGSVVYLEGNTSCTYSGISPADCVFEAPYGHKATLNVKPSIGSAFSGWIPAGECVPLDGVNGLSCEVFGNIEVGAAFDMQKNFFNKRSTESFGTIGEAIFAAEDGDSILALAKSVPTDPSVTIDAKGKTISIVGGYASFSDEDIKKGPVGDTVVNAPLQISFGTVIVSNLVVK